MCDNKYAPPAAGAKLQLGACDGANGDKIRGEAERHRLLEEEVKH